MKRGKYQDGRYDDELVEASVGLIRDWRPVPAPTWVTCVPSRRHTTLVPDFARRVATKLNLPFHRALLKVADRPPQKDMENSAQQARNVDGSLAIVTEGLPPGPVLLIDDVVDSGWTLTEAAYLLCSGGFGPVFPFALAAATGKT